ncbi:terminase [Romboutsia sp. 1001216sp1]|uniref:phage terminase large subunit family protein n=1 Tax=Romboutsia sp. 1001216sp1 TaxID=2986997 RepID=UPI00232D1A00|nr:terminase [Romboutsia sp. 1001216sp1]MDB8790519.1 terminase [Romboutsia sp. 1001216sp1]
MVYYDNLELTDNQYNTYILKKYLDKYYGHDKAIETIKNNIGKLDRIAYALGKKDLSFFCLYYLQDIFVVKNTNEARTLSDSHYEMWNILNKTFVEDEIDKLNIICPRGFAKTTVADLALSVWLICYEKSKFILLGAKKDDDACQFIDSIKKVFKENKKIIEEFGLLIDTKKYKVNANEIEFANGMYIRAVGSSSSVRGANFKGIRPTTVIADDYQDEKDILTDDSREKKFNRWSKEIEKVGDTAVYRNGKKVKSATKIISIGTVLHNDCLISRLSRNKDYYTVLKRAIILDNDTTVDDVFDSELWLDCKKLYFNDKDVNAKDKAREFYLNNINEMKYPILWEEKWDFFNDIAIPYWENRQAFMSEMMNDATSIGEKWFKSIRTQSVEEIEEHNFTKTMLCIDPASTTNKRSDYTAMIVGSVASNDFKYIRHMVLDKFSFNQYCETVIAILKRYEEIEHVYIEKNTFNGADVNKIKELILKDESLSRRNIGFINEMQRKNKDEKISTIIDNVNNGQIIFANNNKEFIEQILEFQGQKYTLHDDAADIVAEFSNRIDETETIGKVTFLDRSYLF